MQGRPTGQAHAPRVPDAQEHHALDIRGGQQVPLAGLERASGQSSPAALRCRDVLIDRGRAQTDAQAERARPARCWTPRQRRNRMSSLRTVSMSVYSVAVDHEARAPQESNPSAVARREKPAPTPALMPVWSAAGKASTSWVSSVFFEIEFSAINVCACACACAGCACACAGGGR